VNCGGGQGCVRNTMATGTPPQSASRLHEKDDECIAEQARVHRQVQSICQRLTNNTLVPNGQRLFLLDTLVGKLSSFESHISGATMLASATPMNLWQKNRQCQDSGNFWYLVHSAACYDINSDATSASTSISGSGLQATTTRRATAEVSTETGGCATNPIVVITGSYISG